MELIINLGTGAFIAALTWIVAVVFGRWWQPSRRRKVIWRMDIGRERQPTLIIDSVPGSQTAAYTRPSTGFGAALSATLVVNSLNAAQAALIRRYTLRREEPIALLPSVDEGSVLAVSTTDSVIIGGPKNNRFAAEFLDAIGCQSASDVQEATRSCVNNPSRVGVATRENAVWWYGSEYQGRVTSDDPNRLSHFSGTDYGVIIRAYSPPSGDSKPMRSVLIFGSQTFGVIGASQYLVQALDLRRSATEKERRLYKALSAHQNVAILVSVEVQSGKVLPCHLIDFYPLNDSVGLGVRAR